MAKAKPKRAVPPRRIQKLALQICQAVVDLTRHRTGRGQKFVMLDRVRQRPNLSDEDLMAAVEFAVESGALQFERKRWSRGT